MNKFVEEKIKLAKVFAESNNPDGSIGFEFEGQWIVNPWLDSTGRFALSDEQAVGFYGLSNIMSYINKAFKEVSEKTRKCVKSQYIYTPQSYIEKMTGECFIFNQEETYVEIEDILDDCFGEGAYWSHSFEEIDYIVQEELPVVLVDVSGFYGTKEMQQMYRWFEVDEDFEED